MSGFRCLVKAQGQGGSPWRPLGKSPLQGRRGRGVRGSCPGFPILESSDWLETTLDDSLFHPGRNFLYGQEVWVGWRGEERAAKGGEDKADESTEASPDNLRSPRSPTARPPPIPSLP